MRNRRPTALVDFGTAGKLESESFGAPVVLQVYREQKVLDAGAPCDPLIQI